MGIKKYQKRFTTKFTWGKFICITVIIVAIITYSFDSWTVFFSGSRDCYTIKRKKITELLGEKSTITRLSLPVWIQGQSKS